MSSKIDRPIAIKVDSIRKDFPALHQEIYGKPLVYLDNAATTQKPQKVIDTIKHYYQSDNANVHRGIHALSSRATERFEKTRNKIRDFIHAEKSEEIIYTRGTTESINLVAQSYGRAFLKTGDEIIISEMEHHSNIVPWQQLCETVGSVLKIIPMNDNGELILETYEKLLNEKTKIVAITHVSNALGTINPIKKIIDRAHAHNAVVLVDGAQATPHTSINVQEIDCDFYALSAHKAFGPTGVGILYGKRELLDKMPPWQGGGEMIKMVTFKKTVYNDLPHKFEAGTPNIASVIGFGATIDYLNQIGLENIKCYESELLNYGTQKLSDVPGLTLIGTAKDKVAVLAFVLKNVHAHDIGTILDTEGIAVRAGHHCAMPIMEHYGVAATVRASLAFYNTKSDIDALINGLHKVREVFG